MPLPLIQQDSTRLFETCHCGGIVIGNEISERSAASSGRHASCEEQVLDRNSHAVKRPPIHPGLDFCFSLPA
jgi:hypothetical protein